MILYESIHPIVGKKICVPFEMQTANADAESNCSRMIKKFCHGSFMSFLKIYTESKKIENAPS